MSDPFTCAAEVRLKPGRDASVRGRHPWVYRGALAGPLPAGPAPVRVAAANGRPLGVALPGGPGSLALRMVAFGDERWDAAALRHRLLAAARLRERLALDADAFRLVHAEGDGLPGLVIDRYGAVAVCQLFAPAWEPLLPAVLDVLACDLGAGDVLLRGGDGAGSAPAVVRGRPAAEVVIREGAVRYAVDLLGGQKTGFFLDQRENRRLVASLSRGASLLNLFSYSGGFAVAALAAGAARAVNVDASPQALALARRAYALNGLPADDAGFVAGDAFRVARALAAASERFGVVVVDPPAFVKRKADLAAGLRGYKDINLHAMRLVEPGGLVLACSCSALVGEDQFGEMLAAAALDAGRTVRVLARRGAGPDHPVSAFCREAEHLKAWLVAVN
ncbi:MAG: class I SAM-dependent rRNA methyltransferase [Acidobacteria bacterium]|nr:MAG: class I SAM-dependent rRNA methyltransferase [Acidobacteriota bacterium]